MKKLENIVKPRLYLGDMDGYTNEKIAEFIERDEVFTTQYGTQDGKSTNAVEVTERQLASALQSKLDRNLTFNVYANYGNDIRLTPVDAKLKNKMLTITQKLARELRKRLIQMKKLPKHHEVYSISIDSKGMNSLP